MGHWNYRVLAQEYQGEIYFQIHEVHYDDNGLPNSYTESPITIGSEDLDGIIWQLQRIKEGLEKPVLWYGDGKFPKEYIDESNNQNN